MMITVVDSTFNFFNWWNVLCICKICTTNFNYIVQPTTVTYHLPVNCIQKNDPRCGSQISLSFGWHSKLQVTRKNTFKLRNSFSRCIRGSVVTFVYLVMNINRLTGVIYQPSILETNRSLETLEVHWV